LKHDEYTANNRVIELITDDERELFAKLKKLEENGLFTFTPGTHYNSEVQSSVVFMISLINHLSSKL